MINTAGWGTYLTLSIRCDEDGVGHLSGLLHLPHAVSLRFTEVGQCVVSGAQSLALLLLNPGDFVLHLGDVRVNSGILWWNLRQISHDAAF